MSQAVTNLGLETKTLYASGPWLVQAFGKLVVVNLFDGMLNDSGSWATFRCPYQLPKGYRPPVYVGAAAVTENGNSCTSRLAVYTDGAIYIANLGGTGASDNRSACVVYIATQ